MKRRLLLLRHAKSDWDAPYGDDHERPLASRGRQAAQAVGRFLRAVDRVPDMILTSSAVRARSTVELAVEAGDWACEVEVCSAFYGATPRGVMAELKERAGEHATVLVAGHEPVWSSLVSHLVGGARVRFPTAALASVRLEGADWSGAEHGTLEWLVTPKLLTRLEASGG